MKNAKTLDQLHVSSTSQVNMRGWINSTPPDSDEKQARPGTRENRQGQLARQEWIPQSEGASSKLCSMVRAKTLSHACTRDLCLPRSPSAAAGRACHHLMPAQLPLVLRTASLDERSSVLEIGFSGLVTRTAVCQRGRPVGGLVVSIEIDPLTLKFARRNLEKAGYR